MSNANRNIKSVVNAARKPCCKVCKDAGKTEAEFSSHWPKDNAGNTICPTLLEQDCRYCGEAGHTVKYCKKLEKDNASKSIPNPSNVAKVGHPSRFALLLEDSDSDESHRTQKKAPVKVREEFPSLGRAWTRQPSNEPVARMSFAAVASKPAQEAIVEKQTRDEERFGRTSYVALTHVSKPLSDKDQAAALRRYECFKGLNGKSWADASDDSDDDCEEVIRSYTDPSFTHGECQDDEW